MSGPVLFLTAINKALDYNKYNDKRLRYVKIDEALTYKFKDN